MDKIVKKRFVYVGSCIVFYIFFIWYYKRNFIEKTLPMWLKFRENIIDDSNQLELSTNRSIFFLETSHIDKNEIILNARQCCAVESAAIMNPTMNIHVFIFTQSLNYTENTKNYIKHLKSYSNIVIKHIDINDYIKNSPLENWWNEVNIMNSSNWPEIHTSDVLRLLTIWKFGGIYFDLDVVVKSSFELLSNFVGTSELNSIENGIFGFEQIGIGYQTMNVCLRELMSDYRGDIWTHNGPRVMSIALQKICDTLNTNEMTFHRCQGITVFPPSTFYPIHWSMWQRYFNHNDENNTMKLIDDAMAIHVWNKLSSSTIIKVGSRVPYALIAEKYCPKIYNNCGEIF